MHESEKKIMLSILDAYLEHLILTNNGSLLARIYGLFTIKTEQFVPVHIMVM